MGNTSYLFNDYWKDITPADISIENGAAADKEDANYPIENSQDEQIASCTRTDDKTNIRILFDINSASGGTKTLKVFYIGNHNFSGGSAKIYSYTANDYTTGLTLEETVAVRALDMYVRIAAPSDRRYWEIDLSNNGTVTSADAYYEWGRIMCYDDLVQFTDKEDYSKPRGYGFKNIINKTPHGIRWVHKLAEKQERFELMWGERTVTNAIISEMRTLYEAVYGDAHPFLYIPDISGTPCYYTYMEDPNLLWSEIFGVTAGTAHVGNINLRLIEAIRGKV